MNVSGHFYASFRLPQGNDTQRGKKVVPRAVGYGGEEKNPGPLSEIAN
jgi:hypothetical protein